MRIVSGEPKRDVRIEKDHFLAFHSTSSGETISPTISTLPLRMPSGLGFVARCGTRSATGVPFLVMTRRSPVRETSSMRERHFALNSEALIVFVLSCSDIHCEHGHDYGQFGEFGREIKAEKIDFFPVAAQFRASTPLNSCTRWPVVASTA